MTFTKAKQEFDAQYGNAVDFHCFIQEHLTFNKVVRAHPINQGENSLIL